METVVKHEKGIPVRYSGSFPFNRDEENVYLPLSSAFHKFAFPETARQFAGGYGEKHKIYSQQHSDRPKEVRQDFHVTCKANRTDLKFRSEDQKPQSAIIPLAEL